MDVWRPSDRLESIKSPFYSNVAEVEEYSSTGNDGFISSSMPVNMIVKSEYFTIYSAAAVQ